MKRDTRRFSSRTPTFPCNICKKVTRDTGHDEAALQLCKPCLFKCYVENAESDYGKDSPEHKEAVERLNSLTK